MVGRISAHRAVVNPSSDRQARRISDVLTMVMKMCGMDSENEPAEEIHWSAYNDEIETLQDICAKEPSHLLSQSSKSGNTCLHVAAAANSLRVIRYLMEFAETAVLDCANSWGETPLHVAAAAANVEVLKIFLAAGANYMLRDRWGRTPKTVALQYDHRSCAEILRSYDGSSEDVVEALDLPDSEEEKRHRESVFGAITKEFLEVRKARVEAARQSEITEQHIFTSHVVKVVPLRPSATLPSLSKFIEYPGDPLQITALLNEGRVDPGGKDMLGYTALHKFVSWDKVDLLELLCPHLSPEQIMIPAGGPSDPNQYSCLHLCVEMRAWRSLKYLTSELNVRRFGVDLEAKDKHNRSFRDFLQDSVRRGEIQEGDAEPFL